MTTHSAQQNVSTFLGRVFQPKKHENDVVEQQQQTTQLAKTKRERNLFSKTKKGRFLNLEVEREKKTKSPGENIHLLSFLYPHTHRIPHSYFAHNGYFFRRQGTHATQFFSFRARLLFASEVPSRVFSRRVIFLR